MCQVDQVIATVITTAVITAITVCGLILLGVYTCRAITRTRRASRR